MERRNVATIDRRLAIGGGFAAAAGLAWPRPQARLRVITQRGIAGGGLVRFAEGEAQFSLFASSLTMADGEEASAPVFLGSVLWVDETVGLTLESTRITNYENLQLASAEGRRIEGVFAAGDSGEHPFVMDVVHVDLPGSGADRIMLTVGEPSIAGSGTPGPDAGFTYSADGEVVVGDVQDIDFAVDPDAGDVSEPEPA